MNMMYTYNLVGRSFRRFRPIAFGIVNLGAPAGNAVMPIIASAFIREYGVVDLFRPSGRSAVCPRTVRSSVCPFVRWSVPLFLCSSVRPFVRSSVRPFVRSLKPYKRINAIAAMMQLREQYN